VLALVPPAAARVLFNVPEGDEGDEAMLGQVEAMLDVFGDAYCNRHVAYNILELVVVRLVPELAERTPGELLGERGIG